MKHFRISLISLVALLFSCSEKSEELASEQKIGRSTTFNIPYEKNAISGDDIVIPDTSIITGKIVDINPLVFTMDSLAAPKTQTVASKLIAESNPKIKPSKAISIRDRWKELGRLESQQEALIKPKRKKIAPSIIDIKSLGVRDNSLMDIRILELEQGLKSAYVRSVLQQSDGHMWIGLFDGGLCRYDGRKLEHFDSGVAINTVTILHEDSDGNVWIGTWGGGLFKYDGYEFQDYSSLLPKEEGDPVSINSYGGEVYISTESRLRILGKSDTRAIDLSHLKMNAGEWLISAIPVSNNELYLVTNHRLFKLTGDRLKVLVDFELESISSAKIQEDGALWLATSQGAFQVKNDSFRKWSKEEGLLIEQIECVLAQADGTLYFGSMQGVQEVKDKALKLISTDSGLSNNMVLSIEKDESSNLWFGTNGGGLSIYRPNSFSHFNSQNGLTNYFVKGVQSGKERDMWFGTFPGDLIHHKNGQFESFGEINPSIVNPVFGVALDAGGGIWFNEWGMRLCYLKNNVLKTYPIGERAIPTRIRVMAFDRDSSLWVGTTEGLVKIENPGKKGERILHFTTKNGFISDRICDVQCDEKGGVWVASEMGISYFPEPRKNKVIHYTEHEGLPYSVVTCMKVNEGERWFGGADKGLFRLDGENLTLYTETDGLSSNKILGITSDWKGRLWVSTANGLNVIDESRAVISALGRQDGLKGTDFYRGSIGIDGNRILWLGNGKGLSRLDLQAWNRNQSPPTAKISAIHVSGKDANEISDLESSEKRNRYESIPRLLRIPYSKNHLSFEFSAIDWEHPGQQEFSYRVIGIANEWTEWSTNNIAEFRNIAPGSYSLEIRVRNPSSQDSSLKSYSFEVLSPWWMKWWAYFIYVLVGLLLLRLIFHLRERRHRLKQRELEQVVNERTDELREERNKVIEKNREILDSINYAQRIQDSMLPNDDSLKTLLGSSFVIYQPKDIVAGDFYWLKKSEGLTYFAVADCTGHGVPGALVSVVCNNALNQALEELKDPSPANLLERTREIVIESFTSSGQDVNDGMDISLAAIKENSNALQWSGANNPLWILRNGELIELKGDKQPIGRYERATKFTNHEFPLEANDWLFLFSDGFQDQFGGDQLKKLKVSGWREILKNVSDMNSTEAEEFVKTRFSTWKGSEEQLDDVCLLAVNIST